MVDSRKLNRIKRHRRIRKRITGISRRPRLVIFRSLKHIYAQIIDDTKGITIVSVSSLDKEFKQKCSPGGNIKAAFLLGQLLSQKVKPLGINEVVFDRGGYPYHGRIKALAEAARKEGLIF